MPAVCTPSANLSIYSCLSCLSKDELLKLLVVILADVAESGYTLPADTPQLLQDSACLTCLDDKKLLQYTVSALAQDVESGSTVAEIRDKIKCLLCANPRQIKAALAHLICRLSPP